ncbi:Sensor protein SrrB [compost metagenome]
MTDGEEAQASLASAEEGVRRLRRTLDQMMTLARTEATVDKADYCESVLAVVSGVLDASPGTARERVGLAVDGEDCGSSMPRSMLETAVRNLVDNALRYSPEQTRIAVHVQFGASARQCVLTVADRGPGLSPEEVVLVGRRFWRADQGRQRKNGTGLGISIVQAIARRFGGALVLKARDGGGLIAELTIPLRAG